MIVENDGKLFTNEKRNNIIEENYNPLNKDYKIFGKEGLCMEEEIILEKIEKELTLEEKEVINKYPEVCMKLYRRGMVDCFNYYNK